MSSTMNIIRFGETGAGKSSVINLISGRPIAEIAPDTLPCTTSNRCYNFSVANRTLNIWDTISLGQPEMGVNDYLPAIEQTCSLINQLERKGGVDLLLHCIRGNQITANTQSHYTLFYEVLCRSQVPIALVITHLEREPSMESWWERNALSLERYGIRAAGHACVTGLPTHPKYRESQHNMVELLRGHKGDGKFHMPPEGRLIESLRLFGMSSTLKKGAKKRDIIRVLTKRCNMDPQMAESVADKLEVSI